MPPAIAVYEVSTPVDYFDLILPAGAPLPRRYRLELESLVSERSVAGHADTAVTIYLGFGDPIVWHEGPSYPLYTSTGESNFAGENNPVYKPPTALFTPQTLKLGFRCDIDRGGGQLWGGTDGTMFVRCPGLVSGSAVAPKYWMNGVAIHDEWPAGALRPNGSPYYPLDPPTQNTCWATPFSYAGTIYGKNGKIPRGFRFRLNGGGSELGDRFLCGRVELHAEGTGTETITTPPPVRPAFTAIGDLSGADPYAFDGTVSKTCGGGTCAWSWKSPDGSNETWVGKAWASPWQPAVMICFPSSDAGFVNTPSPQVTVKAYYSDSAPAHDADGTMIGSQTVTDGPSPVVFSAPASPHSYHWFTVSHNAAPASMYIAQAVIV